MCLLQVPLHLGFKLVVPDACLFCKIKGQWIMRWESKTSMYPHPPPYTLIVKASESVQSSMYPGVRMWKRSELHVIWCAHVKAFRAPCNLVCACESVQSSMYPVVRMWKRSELRVSTPLHRVYTLCHLLPLTASLHESDNCSGSQWASLLNSNKSNQVGFLLKPNINFRSQNWLIGKLNALPLDLKNGSNTSMSWFILLEIHWRNYWHKMSLAQLLTLLVLYKEVNISSHERRGVTHRSVTHAKQNIDVFTQSINYTVLLNIKFWVNNIFLFEIFCISFNINKITA